MSLEVGRKPKLTHKVLILTGIMAASIVVLFSAILVVAEDQMELISLHHWLDAEALRYENYETRYGTVDAMPENTIFDVYWTDAALPRWLSGYTTPGFYEHQLGPEDKHFLVRASVDGHGLNYIVYKDDADDYLDPYESRLHLLAVVLGISIAITLASFSVYLAYQIALPMRQVIAKIALMPPDQPDFLVDSRYQELATIEQALQASKRSIAGYFRREQEFSRFAAHEIRTPLMVLQGSSEILKVGNVTDPLFAKAVNRIQQATQDITLLTDTFLLLGRAVIEPEHFQSVPMIERLDRQLQVFQNQRQADPITVTLNYRVEVKLRAPESFVDVVIANVLKNAYDYAYSRIDVECGLEALTVTNDILPNSCQQTGYGYGLAIVERICDRMEWVRTIEHSDQTFKITLFFHGTP